MENFIEIGQALGGIIIGIGYVVKNLMSQRLKTRKEAHQLKAESNLFELMEGMNDNLAKLSKEMAGIGKGLNTLDKRVGSLESRVTKIENGSHKPRTLTGNDGDPDRPPKVPHDPPASDPD